MAKKGSARYNMIFRRRHEFELGEAFVGLGVLTYLLKPGYEDLAHRGLKAMNSIQYHTPQMRADLEKFFPKERSYVEVKEGTLLVLDKTPDVIMLRDLITHFDGAMDPKHVVWVISSLLNLVCFLSTSGTTHNGLTLENVFVLPKYHSVSILGGWWYSAKVGDTLKTLPPAVYALAPRDLLNSRKADHRLDLESIREIGRVCVGGSSGVAALPRPFANFLRLPAPANPVQDYARWEKVREESYGPRRFLPMNVEGVDVYP